MRNRLSFARAPSVKDTWVEVARVNGLKPGEPMLLVRVCVVLRRTVDGYDPGEPMFLAG